MADDSTLSLTGLVTKRDELRDLVSQLTISLSKATRELKDIELVVEAFERLVSNQDTTSGSTATTTPELNADDRAGTGRPTEDAESPEKADSPIKRVRSTEMVTALLRDAPGPLSRDEIHKQFATRYGIPPSWQNPTQAINNAINRSMENNDVVLLKDGRYLALDESK